MSYVFSFSSRNGAMRFRDALVYNGENAVLVNTPQAAGAGCGMSVRCNDYERCMGVYNRGEYDGLFAVFAFDGREYTRIGT